MKLNFFLFSKKLHNTRRESFLPLKKAKSLILWMVKMIVFYSKKNYSHKCVIKIRENVDTVILTCYPLYWEMSIPLGHLASAIILSKGTNPWVSLKKIKILATKKRNIALLTTNLYIHLDFRKHNKHDARGFIRAV